MALELWQRHGWCDPSLKAAQTPWCLGFFPPTLSCSLGQVKSEGAGHLPLWLPRDTFPGFAGVLRTSVSP